MKDCYIACDGRCIEDGEKYQHQMCYDCEGRFKIKHHVIMSSRLLIVVCLCAMLLVYGLGWAVGYSFKREAVINHVESVIVKSIEQGKPFLFHDGRIGIVLETKFAKNGKTIAYRTISFVYPEEDPAVFVPIRKWNEK
jgi:hypothetical protein